MSDTDLNDYPLKNAQPSVMSIRYHGNVVSLSESDVFDFCVTLGIAKRSSENAGEKGEAVRRIRKIWTRLGVWGEQVDDQSSAPPEG